MQYFKHSDLTDRYHVSLKTVHNWIDNAKQKKIGLTLCKIGNRTYIEDTPGNRYTLEKLAIKGKKYRNSLYHKTVSPNPEFYDIYSRRQILDIINNLETHGEVPRMYNYLEEGANNWDKWLKTLVDEPSPNILTGTIELLHTNLDVLDRLLESGKKINVIDLGVGNAYPIRELLGHLVERGVLHRYIGIDISPPMLKIAEDNIREWFGDKVNFEGYVRDISYERFDDLVVDDMLNRDAPETINLVLLLGLTPVNFRSFGSIFDVVHESMGGNDLLIFTNKQDTEISRRYFDFNTYHKSTKLSPNHKYILDLLNIDESLYDVEMGFDELIKMRYVRIRLKTALTVGFNFSGYNRAVNFEKGDTILLLRVWHLTSLEIITLFEDKGFTMLHTGLTKDRQHFMSISGVETKNAYKR